MTGPESAPFESLERDLRSVLHWQPSASAVETMNRGLAQIMATSSRPSAGWIARWSTGWRPVVALLAAALLLLGAASALTLLQEAANVVPEWRTRYEQGEPIGVSQTIGEYTVSIERAYADAEVLVLGVSLVGPADTFPAFPQLTVTDADGGEFVDLGSAVSGDSASGGSGSIHAFEVPETARGIVDLTITVEPLKSSPLTDLSSTPAWFSTSPWDWPMEEPGLVGPWTFHLRMEV